MRPALRARLWSVLPALAALIALLAIYGGLVVRDPILTRDDQSLLSPLYRVHSMGDYLRARAAHQILDLQPIRDGSFLLDIQLSRWLGRGTFHATNLILWIAIVALAFLLMRLVHGRAPVVAPAVAIFAVHPVFVGSVAWIAARKHLLACLFIVAVTLLFERARRRGTGGVGTSIAIVALYLASTLAQPITALWPLWAAITLAANPDVRMRRLWWTVAGAAAVMVCVLGANYAYYTGDYVQRLAVQKFEDTGGAHWVGLLALGRYFGDFLWPTRLAATYTPGAAIEVVGLVALAAGTALLLIVARRREVLVWGAFTLFPLALVTVRMTNVYASDTYALTSGVGLLSLGLLLVERWRAAAALALVLFVLLVPLSMAQARTWSSDAALWAQAWRVSPTPSTTARHAYYLLHTGHPAEAERLLESIPRAARTGDVAQVQGQLVYQSALPLDEKIRRLEAEPAAPWRNYYLAASDAGAGRLAAAWALMRDTFADNPRFGDDLPVVVAESQYFCEQGGGTDCVAWVQQLRQRLGGWDEQRFAARRSELTVPR